MDSPGAVGRRRGNSRINAEDQALDQIAKEASANPPPPTSSPSSTKKMKKNKKKRTRSSQPPPPSEVPTSPPRAATGTQHERSTVVAERSGPWAVEAAVEESPARAPDYLQEHEKCVYKGRTGRWDIRIKEEDEEQDQDQDDVDLMIKSIIDFERSQLDLDCHEGRKKSKKKKKNKKKSKKQKKSQGRELKEEADVVIMVTESLDDLASTPQQEGAVDYEELFNTTPEIQVVLYPPLEEHPADEAVTTEIINSFHDDSGAVLEVDSPPKPLKDLAPTTPLDQMTLADLKDFIKLEVSSSTADMSREIQSNSVQDELILAKIRLLSDKISFLAEIMESSYMQPTTREVAIQVPDVDLLPAATSTPEDVQTSAAPTIPNRRPDETPLNPARIVAPTRQLAPEQEESVAEGCYVAIEPYVAGRDMSIAAGQWIAIGTVRDRVG